MIKAPPRSLFRLNINLAFCLSNKFIMELVKPYTALQYDQKWVNFTQGLDFSVKSKGKTGKDKEKPAKMQRLHGLSFLYSIFLYIFLS